MGFLATVHILHYVFGDTDRLGFAIWARGHRLQNSAVVQRRSSAATSQHAGLAYSLRFRICAAMLARSSEGPYLEPGRRILLSIVHRLGEDDRDPKTALAGFIHHHPTDSHLLQFYPHHLDTCI